MGRTIAGVAGNEGGVVLRLFHGGKPGLTTGDVLTGHEPNVVDGCPICEAKRRGENPLIDPTPAQPNRVYLTADRIYARFYASKYPTGDLYVVEPVGELVASAEDPFPTWTAEAAIVRSVYGRAIRLTDSERRNLLRRWPDEHGNLPTRFELATLERTIIRGGRDLARHAAHNRGELA